MKKWKAAVIGCGRIASVYMEAFYKLKDQVDVVLAVDKVGVRAEAFAESFPGCRWEEAPDAETVRGFLQEEKPDVVHILLPHHLHCSYVVVALECGCHVLTEKPISLTLEEADQMIDAAKKQDRKLGVIFQNRYITGIREVKKRIDAGEFGKATGAFSNLNWYRPPSYYECDWKGRWDTEGGGVVIDQAIHSIDLVRYLIGEEIVELDGHYSCRVLSRQVPNVEVEDEADAAIRFQSGAVYSFFATNYYVTNCPIQIDISFERGRVHLDYQTVTIWNSDGTVETIEQESCPDSHGEDYWGSCHYLQIQDFYNALEQEREVPWDPQDAKKTLEVVLSIYRSSREQRTIRLGE